MQWSAITRRRLSFLMVTFCASSWRNVRVVKKEHGVEWPAAGPRGVGYGQGQGCPLPTPLNCFDTSSLTCTCAACQLCGTWYIDQLPFSMLLANYNYSLHQVHLNDFIAMQSWMGNTLGGRSNPYAVLNSELAAGWVCGLAFIRTKRKQQPSGKASLGVYLLC